MKILSHLIIEVHPHGRLFKLVTPFSVETPVQPDGGDYEDFPFAHHLANNEGITITVPTGFVTDFASVPQVIWSLIPPIGMIALPAVVHDWIYTNHPQTRKWADAVLYEGCRSQGMGRIQAFLIWSAVRIFGRPSWKNQDGPFNDSKWK